MKSRTEFLLYFDKLYDKFTDMEKKEFLNSFVEQVDIYEQEQADGRFLKHIKFRFPVYFNNGETTDICWDVGTMKVPLRLWYFCPNSILQTAYRGVVESG